MAKRDLASIPGPFRTGTAGSAVPLSIAADVDRIAGRDVAVSDCPWLRLDVEVRGLAGRWIRLTYRSGLLEPLTRPMLRSFGGEGFADQMLPAALLGRAIWLGRIPAGATDIWISPTNRPGPFSFAIERIELPGRLDLDWSLFRRSPKRWGIRLIAPLIGLPRAADIQIRRVLSATPLGRYDAWRSGRVRPLDLPGFDGPDPGGTDGPHVRFVTQASGDAGRGLAELVSTLGSQPFPHWTLAVLDAPVSAPISDSRVLRVGSGDPQRDVLAGLGDDALVAPLAPGDTMPSYGVAAFAQAAAAERDVAGFFGDTDAIDGRGRHCALQLRPDWSPILFETARDLGSATAFRAGLVRRLLPQAVAGDLMRLTDALAEGIIGERLALRHIRRVLRTRSPGSAMPAGTPPPQRPRLCPAGLRAATAGPRATIIIPTRDKLDLLGQCIGSLRTRKGLEGAEVIVVDNGSTGDDMRLYLSDLVRDDRFRVLPDHGPFNFSRLCNAAAALARSPTLVFLNNDTEITSGTWLDPLIGWAGRADVGAVGAKLLYPDGRLQHAGVTVGLDGIAGHLERLGARDDPGYFGRLGVAHDVSAVTGACLAVEAWKFRAVGGFDEASLAIDLNDVDLCLRLAAAGWRCVLAPESLLIHHESASRGMTHQPHERYRTEHAAFRSRWLSAIRDDPYFHPALSLDSLSPALG